MCIDSLNVINECLGFRYTLQVQASWKHYTERYVGGNEMELLLYSAPELKLLLQPTEAEEIGVTINRKIEARVLVV